MIRILLLGLVLAGVWYLYRMVTRQGASGATPVGPAEDSAAIPPSAEGEAPLQEAAATEQAAAVEEEAVEPPEMIECPLCHAYVPEAARDGCGRPDCPIPALAAARGGSGGVSRGA